MSSPQFKVDIRKAPIAEEGQEADAALASVASTLRAVGVAIDEFQEDGKSVFAILKEGKACFALELGLNKLI